MNRIVLFWLVAIAVLVIALGAWIVQTRPSDKQVAAAIRQLPPLPSEVISSEVMAVLNARTMNGTLPVAPATPGTPRGNPFSQ